MSFLQSARDWGDIYGEIGPAGHIDTERNLNDQFETAVDALTCTCGVLLAYVAK